MDPSGNFFLTFKDIIDTSAINLSSDSILSLNDIFFGLLASLICSLIISWTYLKTYQGILYQKSFNISIIMVCLVTTSVIMVISGNLVLSLGMVGALSIVRFRAAIKDPIDIVYMFWAVAVGIANGVANVKVSFSSTIFIALVVIFITKMPISIKKSVLVINCNIQSEEAVMALLKKESKRFYIQSKNITENNIELIIESSVETKNNLANNLSAISGVNHVNILAYTNNVLDN